MSYTDFDSVDPTVWEPDVRPSDESWADSASRIAIIRNSDRHLFRRCRRRWAWSSHLKQNLRLNSLASPLWFGSGVHFALEDFHGDKAYPTIVDAFLAYVEATKKQNRKGLPGDWPELSKLGEGMLNYYVNDWLVNRPSYRTFVWKGVPQVEVNFRIEIPWPQGKFGYDRVIYSGTIDRVVIDDDGFLWFLEYKTAKVIQTLHLALDPQVSSYVWAGDHLYPGYQVAGVIYQQHRKTVPKPPEFTRSGFSTDARQLTTYQEYGKALEKSFGSINRAPSKNVDFYNKLVKSEDLDWSKFIRRDRTRRNEHQRQAEGVKVMLEIEEMLNPETPLYPSPTRDCVYLCDFKSPCESLDDGSDWEYELALLTRQRDKEYDLWRKYLPSQQTLFNLEEVTAGGPIALL